MDNIIDIIKMCNGNTPILKEKVSGPMSFYHLKKEGEKNIYLFGDVHASSDNICDIKDTNSDLFHIFVKKLYNKYPRISFDIGFEEAKYGKNYINKTTPLRTAVSYFRNNHRLKAREKSDIEDPSQLVRFHYMDIRSQTHWHKNGYFFNMICYFDKLFKNITDSSFNLIINLEKINNELNLANELKEEKYRILNIFNAIKRNYDWEIIPQINTFDEFKKNIGENQLKYILWKEKLQNKISINNIYDLFEKLYLNIYIRYDYIFIDYEDYINNLENKKKAIFLLFQNNESIIQNYISEKINIVEKIDYYNPYNPPIMNLIISKRNDTCSRTNDGLYICDLKNECKNDICQKSDDTLETKLKNTIIIMIKTTKIYTKMKSYTEFPLSSEVIDTYIETRIKKIIKDSLKFNINDVLIYLNDTKFSIDDNYFILEPEKYKNVFNFIEKVFDDILVLLMDLYSIIRISKKYQKNVILYFGDFHIVNIKDFFLKNGYELEYSNTQEYDIYGETQPNRCVNIGDSFSEKHFIR